MTVIAEGVESKDAAETARMIGCKMGQGYYLGEPSISEAQVIIENPSAPVADAVETDNAGDDVLVLDQSLKTPQRSRLFRRRLFSSAGR